ncbi:putative monosaccharide-transporting ATPase [Medicago truncatula]|uniref:Putative monosaccharide-transporting ATPase n=1 Tax=Medicago truncatula TaxID=3880 RepID=G7I503_MEDTR|nr:ABC transporter G family member 24 isoform X1 [Medicago truncatula]AES62116.1 white-brown-complex ABC transporter family protein, putative [Medicago truncatula]RHN81469.1 putative monosaccharide-transporting ATPase [Medicago truncatula]
MCSSWRCLVWLVLTLSMLLFGEKMHCQEMNDYDQLDNPAVLPLITQLVYTRISNLTSILSQQISKDSNFCVKDPDSDWNQAFNFSSDLRFLSSCIKKTKGDISNRLCTAAEVKFYLNSLMEKSSSANYLKPNRNCNLTSWVSGCEPGWACSVPSGQKIDLKDSKEMPARTSNCRACCEGFFCPHGITCMIPCPLGSYCPIATLNKTTGVCEPYLYQLPPMQPNHTCGGANVWADFSSSSETFCSAGSYCPTTTTKFPCSSGHYCRTGSTSAKRCFKLSSCNSNTATQNMHAYGVMLIAALSTLLLIIYNCSDQVLTTRERRVAKSRESAARSARKTANAHQRWKVAKDAAKKGATGLQAQLSRKFSRKKDEENLEKVKILNQETSETDVELLPHSQPSNMVASSSAVPTEKGKTPSGLMHMMHEIENDPHVNYNPNTGKETRHKSATKEKQPQTNTQIFKYAYAQLEKEKAQQQENKNLTFSGVLKMATNTEKSKRPFIEISFRDLTLTLKAQNKHILRNVTGKIKPGRITAIMGPSGAGKTTFLSALAGKALGCLVTGSILINGRNESIHSFKKIIGFVPQDDVVHGNLTVEENLWFSAQCRLSADLSKPEKVLVVERVIEFLGLQSVRNSVVGTVEKRGVSGGQRKRVNVGLEMVMEPSLLMLDEPTSGLDSASSQLLLRALRREALEGVNICMVVHQPSYALFNMFDDLILLGKGGLMVYHGSAKKVEEYFSGLGINVPERINPPDYYIDILEGIAAPGGSSGLSYQDLPVKWMLHNEYPIPLDMRQHAAQFGIPQSVNSANDLGEVGKTFAGELWNDVRSNVELRGEKIRLNFLKSKDLSNRKTPGVFKQYKYFLIRVGKQRLREARIQAVDYLILLLAGACLGSITKSSDQTFGASGYTYTVIAVSLLCKIAALRSFSLDKLHYWRESDSGMSSLAYFLSKDTMDHFNTVIKPVVYLSMFYFLTNPRSTFTDNYIVLLCLVYCVTGIAYALSIVFEPGAAQLWSVLLPVVSTLIATQQKDSKILKAIANLCYSKWALQALVIANAERYQGVWLITRCGSLLKSGYNLHDWSLCISILILMGVIGRAIAFFCMVTFKKK